MIKSVAVVINCPEGSEAQINELCESIGTQLSDFVDPILIEKAVHLGVETVWEIKQYNWVPTERDVQLRMLTEETRSFLVGALDTLGTALATHNHTWTDGERAIYEEAQKLLGVK